MVETLPAQIVLGIYLGVLTGIIPALVSWTLGFLFKYFTGVSAPGVAVAIIGTALAGVSGGLTGLLDPAIAETWVGITALLVVLMACLWAHDQGDEMGEVFPRRVTLKSLRERTLSTDAIERVGRFGQVRITVAGEVGDIEGYPPLPDAVRAAIREDDWTFPADLPVSELETRLVDQLLTEYDLADATVSVDRRGEATVAAAPASGALSRRVPPGKRAVSFSTLVPTGLARGDEVVVSLPDRELSGSVVSAKTDGEAPEPAGARAGDAEENDGTESAPPERRAPTATGGEGRLTIAVGPRDARALLGVERAEVRVRARGTRREYELIGLLKRAGSQFRRMTVVAGSHLDGRTLAEARDGDDRGVAVLAIRRPNQRLVAPGGETRLGAGDELIVAGSRGALRSFEEAVA